MTEAGGEPAWEEALGDFWAGLVEELRVSLARHRVVNDGPDLRAGRRAFEGDRPQGPVVVRAGVRGVTRVIFNDSDASPWWVTELTEVGKRPAEGGKTEYGFDLTSLDDALMITCEDVRVTFLQRDEMPDHAVR